LIDAPLTHRGSNLSLRIWYQKFNAYNDAGAKLAKMKSAGTWPLTYSFCLTDLINVFSTRSYWHSHIMPGFKDIHNYPDMVDWLERGEDESTPSDLDVWHCVKTHYSFKDLRIWKQNGTLDAEYQRQLRQKQKEKGKGKARQQERKEKGDVIEEAPVTKKQKRKSGTGKASSSRVSMSKKK
jgi:hypothetical protein